MTGNRPLWAARRLRFGALFLTSLFVLNGCNDPRFIAQRDLRHRRIERRLAEYRQHDAAGPQRIQRTLAIHEQLKDEHEKSLAKTCALCKKLHEDRVERWRSQRDLRRQRARDILYGHPERIGDTWAKMVY